MPNAHRLKTTGQPTRLLDLIGGAEAASGASLGANLLRLATMAAAIDRATQASSTAEPWRGLTTVQDLISKDNAGHGRPAEARSARPGGTVTTEGDR